MVSNISTDIDETQLEELFGYYGKIRKIHIAKISEAAKKSITSKRIEKLDF